MKKNYFFILLIIFFKNIQTTNRINSLPFISGDTFRELANFTFDNEYTYAKTNFKLNPENVKCGDIIFVSTEPEGNLENFFLNFHPKINQNYILITHNGDGSAPGRFSNFLNDKKLFKWFGQNSDIRSHPKFIAIPIGLENIIFNNNYVEIIKKINTQNYAKRFLFYANLNIQTNRIVREPIINLFKQKSFCYFCPPPKKSVTDYLIDVSQSKFILSPHGNGLDCIRTWEALYLNTIPVVKSSTLDILYEDLPVLIVNEWDNVTEEFLKTEYLKIQTKKFKKEKLYFDYWKNLIKYFQEECRKTNN